MEVEGHKRFGTASGIRVFRITSSRFTKDWIHWIAPRLATSSSADRRESSLRNPGLEAALLQHPSRNWYQIDYQIVHGSA
jgi:hypothetical protein